MVFRERDESLRHLYHNPSIMSSSAKAEFFVAEEAEDFRNRIH